MDWTIITEWVKQNPWAWLVAFIAVAVSYVTYQKYQRNKRVQAKSNYREPLPPMPPTQRNRFSTDLPDFDLDSGLQGEDFKARADKLKSGLHTTEGQLMQKAEEIKQIRQEIKNHVVMLKEVYSDLTDKEQVILKTLAGLNKNGRPAPRAPLELQNQQPRRQL